MLTSAMHNPPQRRHFPWTVCSPPLTTRLTLDVASMVVRIGRAEPHRSRASRGHSRQEPLAILCARNKSASTARAFIRPPPDIALGTTTRVVEIAGDNRRPGSRGTPLDVD